MEPVAKPPYRIPSLQEIRANAGSTGLTVASTFSGCGGTCLGLTWAGMKVVWASEFVPAAADSYRQNHPDTVLDTRDIRTVTADDIVRAVGHVDILEGSPPCAAYSMCGARDRKWGRVRKYSDTEQRVDDLIDEWLRILEQLRPRAYTFENVAGLVRGRTRGVYLDLRRRLTKLGYTVTAGLVDAAYLGVPQHRVRLFIVGALNNVRVELPKPLPYTYSIKEAFENLPPCPPHENVPRPLYPSKLAEWRKLPYGGQSRRYMNLIRSDPSKPANTLVAAAGDLGASSICHWDEPRKFTVPEARRLCGFPDDYKLTGTYQQRIERLGRSVAPPVARAIGQKLAEALAT